MNFERTPDYEQKLFEQALFDEKKVIKDANVIIVLLGGKLKAFCENTNCYLQFPRHLRQHHVRYVCDVVEVKNENVNQNYYRAMPKSIRYAGSDEVLA